MDVEKFRLPTPETRLFIVEDCVYKVKLRSRGCSETSARRAIVKSWSNSRDRISFSRSDSKARSFFEDKKVREDLKVKRMIFLRRDRDEKADTL